MTVAVQVQKLLKKSWMTTKQLNKSVGSTAGERSMRKLRASGVKLMTKKEAGVNKYKIKG